MSTKVLFWDIDGTLLTTGRAGIYAWEQALGDTTGAELDFRDLNTAGLTDIEIAENILYRSATAPSPNLVRSLVSAYEDYLPECLPRREGRVLEGVESLLSAASNRGGYQSILLTGNTEKGAWAKLRYYGLIDWFTLGSFAGERKNRVDIAKYAFELARREIGAVGREEMFVIGDTPHDIKCGKSIGVRTIAVATGEYAIDELRQSEPWRAISKIGEVESFLGLIDMA